MGQTLTKVNLFYFFSLFMLHAWAACGSFHATARWTIHTCYEVVSQPRQVIPMTSAEYICPLQ
jgi:hypothetical protein